MFVYMYLYTCICNINLFNFLETVPDHIRPGKPACGRLENVIKIHDGRFGP